MRSGLLAVVMVSLAACEPATGLQFDIDATRDPTATEVVVYIGKGDGDAASIAAELRSPSDRHQGRFWPLGLEPERFELTASERTATLSFAPGGSSSKVTVVAVGLTQGAPSSVATKVVTKIRTDLVEIWTLQLEPIKDDVDIAVGRAVQRWGEQPGEHTCVQAVDRAAANPELTNIFIGKAGDRDCDGQPRFLDDGSPNPAECDDDWHNARVKPSIDTLSCMKEYAEPGLTDDVCILGGPQCVDGEGANNTACSHARPFCAPAALCARCPPASSPEDRFRCALEADPVSMTSATFVPYMRCPIQINTTTNPPSLCPVRLRASPSAAGPLQATCTGAPRYHSSDDSTGWSSLPTIGGLSLELSYDQISSGCSVMIVPKEVPGQAIATGGFSEHGLIALDLTINRGVVGPIVFDFEETGECAVENRDCSSFGGGTMTQVETIFRCVQAGL